MTNKTLNPNFWVAGADDKLKTKDVYQLAGTLAINAIENYANSIDPSIAEAIRGGRAMADKLKSALNTVNDVKKILNSSNAAERLLALAPQLKSTLKSTTGIEISDALIGQVQAAGSLMVGAGNAYRQVKATDFSNAHAVGKLLNEYTKDNALYKISDLGATAELTAGLINIATKNGIPNSLEALTANIIDTGLVRQIASRTIPDTVLMCDLMGISTIVDRLGEQAISDLMPNALSSVFKNWAGGNFCARSTSDGASYSDTKTKVATFLELIAVLDKADPNWRWHTRKYINAQNQVSTERVISVVTATEQSGDMEELLMTGVRAAAKTDLTTKMLALSTVFKGYTVAGELAKHFPKTVTRNAVVSTSNTDPASLSYA